MIRFYWRPRQLTSRSCNSKSEMYGHVWRPSTEMLMAFLLPKPLASGAIWTVGVLASSREKGGSPPGVDMGNGT
jgi:hypothetical protein